MAVQPMLVKKDHTYNRRIMSALLPTEDLAT